MNDTLQELRKLQAGIEQDTQEYFRSIGWFMGGVLLGAGGMFCVMFSVYEQTKVTKPVVTVEQDGARAGKEAEHAPVRSDAAPPPTQAKADEVRQLQRVKELRFSLEKLERMKAIHNASLREAATNQGDIREMVAKLGEVKR